MQRTVSRRGTCGPAATLLGVICRAAPGLALLLALAAPARSQTAPQIAVSCTSGVSFIATPICTSMTTSRGGVLLTNVGTMPLVISSLTFSGPNADEFSVSQGCVGTILTGQLCSLVITFTPKGSGLRTAFLNVNSNAPGSPFVIPVNGIGTGSGGGLSPSSVSFGNQVLGATSAPQSLTLTNTGNANLNITGVSLSAGSPFAITSGGTTGSVAVGASRTITVTFTPTAAGNQTATLTVATDSLCGSFIATLSGTGVSNTAGPAAVSLTGAAFANQCVGTTSAAQTVTLTNTGGSALNITSITVPSGSPFQITSGNQAGTLAAGASRSILVTFTPTVSGLQTANLTVASSAATSPNTITLSATGITAASTATLTPGTLAFGSQTMGTASAAQNLTLTNTSGTALTLTGITLTGANAGSFQITAGGTAGTLAAGATQTISVVFNPIAGGAQTGTLTVTSAALCGPLTVTLSGTGTAVAGAGGAAAVTLSRSYISFADLCLGRTAGPLCFTITNTGGAALVINNIGIANCSSSVNPTFIDCATVAGFQIVSGGGLGTLAAGASRDVCITFTPGEAATFSAFVMISTNASTTPTQVELHGTGDLCPGPQVSLTGATFANQCVGTTSAAQTVTLKNTGTADLVISSISFPSGSPFQITGGGAPGTLAVGATRSITVTFTPSGTGLQTAVLTVASNAATSPNTITLSATGITSASIATLLPGTLAFGSQTVNTTSAAQNVTLTNTSGAPLTISGIALSASAPFAITAGGTPGTLAAGATQTISVVFKPTPTTTGAQTATLTVTSAALCGPLTVTLTGTGTAVAGAGGGAVTLSRSYISFADLCIGRTAGPLCFTITNTGGAALVINSIGITNCSSSVDPHFIDCATVAGFQIVSGGAPGTLAAGASRDVCITFTPGEAATFSAFVMISTSASTTPTQVELHGTGDLCPGPQVSLTGPTFANQCVGTTSAAQTVTLKNTGTADLIISSIMVPAPFQITGGGAPGTLAAGATRSITVTFTPGAPGLQTAVLTVASNATTSPNTITLSATGITSASIATLTPASLTFGSQTMGTTSAAQNLTLTNTSGAALTLTGIALGGANPGSFLITAGGTPGTLASGATQTISVAFKPAASGAQAATLTVTSAALCGPLTVTLAGTGTAVGAASGAAVGLALTSAGFGTQCVGTTSAAQTVTLTNTGGSDLIISSIMVPAPFHITSGGTAGTLAAGASRLITVTFAPLVAGLQTADLTVVSNAATSPNKLTLSATGITSASIATLTPGTLAFGNQAVSTPSAAKNLTLTNTSGAPLTIGAVTLTGANAGSFQITAGGAAGTLAAGATRTISVLFNPTTSGAQTATLTVTSAALCGPLTVALSGTGICPALSITCPPDLNVGVPEGQCAATGITITPTVTPNVASTTVTCVRSDGQPLTAPFPFGTTTITCTARDACGNTAQCVQHVTVCPLGQTEISLFIAAVNGVPTTGTPDQVNLNVGDCVTLKVLVTVAGCSSVLDVTGSSTFFTDPTRGTFTGSTWCATAAEANLEFPLYGNWVNPCTGIQLRDTVHVHVNPLP